MKIHFPVGLATGVALVAFLAGCGGGGSTMTPPLGPSTHNSATSAAPAAMSSDPLATQAIATTVYISKLKAEQIALKAVGGGSVLLAVLETTDYPVHWSIDVANRRGEFEVWVDARTGKVLKIIVGG